MAVSGSVSATPDRLNFVTDELHKAQQVLSSLKRAELAEGPEALSILNGLAGLVQSANGHESIETDELRSSAFLAICEIAKALHRGQPATSLWAAAMNATERWCSSAK